MPSIAQNHFPGVRWRNGEKRLWNPIARRTFRNRPEERVRLRILDALMDAGWSKNRISTEEVIPDQNRRTDIICYDEQFKPYLLVECKAERVSISEEVALQTARYNRDVGAGELLMSNGVEDYWYRVTEDGKTEKQHRAPERLSVQANRESRDSLYWEERLFAGEKASQKLRDWLTGVLPLLWFEAEGENLYIDFEQSPGGLDLAHYYKVLQAGELKLAITFLGTPSGTTNLVVVFNRETKNLGLLEIELDRYFSGNNKKNAMFFSSGKADRFDIDNRSPGLFKESAEATVLELPTLLAGFFETYK